MPLFGKVEQEHVKIVLTSMVGTEQVAQLAEAFGEEKAAKLFLKVQVGRRDLEP